MSSIDIENIKLTQWTSCGGCAAKWGGSSLSKFVGNLATGVEGSLLVGLAPYDDAAIFQLSENQALVSTTDFFPPLVDDPADFGSIAAANACSDVFAMGGRVILALNIAAFPEHLPEAVIGEIFHAAAETVRQAGGIVAGGHTIRSDEPIFGLAVQGVITPNKVLTKGGARPGDILVLSKPIGTGIVLAGGTEGEKRDAIGGMRQLNKEASHSLLTHFEHVHAATDVTGFGLLGHGWEIAERSSVPLVFEAASVPLYSGTLEIAERGVSTGGDARNRQQVNGHVDSSVSAVMETIVFDPQTSGGLLAAVEPHVVQSLEQQGFTAIGYAEEGKPEIRLR